MSNRRLIDLNLIDGIANCITGPFIELKICECFKRSDYFPGLEEGFTQGDRLTLDINRSA